MQAGRGAKPETSFLFLFIQKKKRLLVWSPANSMTDATALRKHWIASLRSQ
jgi:hypothetical protein